MSTPPKVAVASPVLARRSGIPLDAARLDHELAKRGLSARRLAEVAGIPEVTLSRARHGRPVSDRTLRKISAALLSIPALAGADLVMADRRS